MAAPILAPPFRLIALDTVDSTNDEARRRAAAGAAPFTVVWAQAQTAGRGRRGRNWVSPRGNLHVSLLLRPERPMAEVARLSFAAAVALGEALAELLPPGADLACKWPNDLLLAGRKVAGMLLESAGEGQLVLGLGVDVAEAPEPALHRATCLAEHGFTGDAGQVLEAFCRHFIGWFTCWRDQGFAPVRAAWLSRASGLGGQVTARLDDATYGGSFAGLDEDGALLLDLDGGGRRRVLAGDVFFGAPPLET